MTITRRPFGIGGGGKADPGLNLINAADHGAAGNGTTDDTADLASAMDAANAAGAALFLPSGTYLCGAISKSYAPRIYAVPGTVTILASAASGWLWSFAGSIGSSVSVTANVDRGDYQIAVSSTDGLATGDLIRISDGQASYAAQATRTQGQTVEIASVDSATTLTLTDPAYASFTTAAAAVIQKVTAPAGTRVSGIKFVNTNPAATVGLLRLTYLRDVEVDAHSVGAGAAGVRLEHCHDFRVNMTCERHFDGGAGQFGYGVEVNGACAHGQINVRANRVRHAVSGSGIDNTPGEPVNIRVSGVAHGTTGQAWDWHAQGSDILFENCAAYGSRSFGFALRGRRQHVQGGIVQGGYGGVWLFEAANDNRIAGVRISDIADTDGGDTSGSGGRGIRVAAGTGGLTVTGCELVNIARDGIVLNSTGTDVVIEGNLFRNVGRAGAAGNRSAIHAVGALTRARIRDNTVQDNQGTKTTLAAVTLDSASTDTLIRGNDVAAGITALTGSGAASAVTRTSVVDRVTAWLPSGAKQSTIPGGRTTALSSGGVLVSGRLTLAGGIVLPAGETISSISFVAGGTGASAPTNQWFCLIDQALNVLAMTVDDTTAPWSFDSVKTLAISGGYTPVVDTPVYLGVVVVATTVPTLQQVGVSSAAARVAPIMAATANTGLTDPASLASVGTLTALPNLAYGWVS